MTYQPFRVPLVGALVALCASPGPLAAADGTPMSGGMVAFNRAGSNADAARAVAPDPSGWVLLAGTVANNFGDWALGLARAGPAGYLDPSFGVSGRVVDPFGFGITHTGTALEILPDGRLLVAGTVDHGAGNEDFYVGRLLADGSRDLTFNVMGGGVITVAFDLGDDDTDTLGAMTVDRSGRIVVVGTVDVAAGDTDIGVVRLTADGQLDSTFSSDGKTTIPISPFAAFDFGLAAATDASNRIIVGGGAWTTAQGGNFDQALARLLADGSLDPSFGTAGKVIVGAANGGTNNELVWAVGVWPDGEVVAAGDVATGANSWSFLIRRFSPSGTFSGGVSGRYCVASPPCPAQPQDSARALLLEGDGKIVIGGFGLGPAGNSDFAVARFGRTLAPDLAFGTNGLATVDFAHGSGYDSGAALSFDGGGRILLAGSAEQSGFDTDFAWLLLDSSFVFADGWEGGDALAWSDRGP